MHLNNGYNTNSTDIIKLYLYSNSIKLQKWRIIHEQTPEIIPDYEAWGSDVLPPLWFRSFSTRLLGGARSTGSLPWAFLLEQSAPWSRRTETSSGLELQAAACRGDSPFSLLFTLAPGEGQNTNTSIILKIICCFSVQKPHHIAKQIENI